MSKFSEAAKKRYERNAAFGPQPLNWANNNTEFGKVKTNYNEKPSGGRYNQPRGKGYNSQGQMKWTRA